MGGPALPITLRSRLGRPTLSFTEKDSFPTLLPDATWNRLPIAPTALYWINEWQNRQMETYSWVPKEGVGIQSLDLFNSQLVNMCSSAQQERNVIYTGTMSRLGICLGLRASAYLEAYGPETP